MAAPETPFCGVKNFGHGSDGGLEGILAYLTSKVISQLDGPNKKRAAFGVAPAILYSTDTASNTIGMPNYSWSTSGKQSINALRWSVFCHGLEVVPACSRFPKGESFGIFTMLVVPAIALAGTVIF